MQAAGQPVPYHVVGNLSRVGPLRRDVLPDRGLPAVEEVPGCQRIVRYGIIERRTGPTAVIACSSGTAGEHLLVVVVALLQQLQRSGVVYPLVVGEQPGEPVDVRHSVEALGRAAAAFAPDLVAASPVLANVLQHALRESATFLRLEVVPQPVERRKPGNATPGVPAHGLLLRIAFVVMLETEAQHAPHPVEELGVLRQPVDEGGTHQLASPVSDDELFGNLGDSVLDLPEVIRVGPERSRFDRGPGVGVEVEAGMVRTNPADPAIAHFGRGREPRIDQLPRPARSEQETATAAHDAHGQDVVALGQRHREHVVEYREGRGRVPAAQSVVDGRPVHPPLHPPVRPGADVRQDVSIGVDLAEQVDGLANLDAAEQSGEIDPAVLVEHDCLSGERRARDHQLARDRAQCRRGRDGIVLLRRAERDPLPGPVQIRHAGHDVLTEAL